MKKSVKSLLVLGAFCLTPGTVWGRLWVDQKISLDGGMTYVDTGVSPSLALLFGVQPVVSTYNMNTPSQTTIVHRTPFGWETYNQYVGAGYIAGDGGQRIAAYRNPVNYGQDGNFYSYGYGSTNAPVRYQGGTWVSVGPSFSPGDSLCSVSASFEGKVYMASASPSYSKLAQLNGSTWVEPSNPDNGSGSSSSGWNVSLARISDLAVSPFGEVAVAGYDMNNQKTVAWYDYKSSTWYSRMLPGTDSIRENSIGLAWDSLGNLGVAYSYSPGGGSGPMQLLFDYLDLGHDLWTREVALDNVTGANPLKGAALAFDRFDRPVLASGTHLVYDPVVPEPAALLVWLTAGWLGRRWFKRG